jgi:hypothetical protein
MLALLIFLLSIQQALQAMLAQETNNPFTIFLMKMNGDKRK